MVLSTFHRRCQTVPEAELQKAFSALLLSTEPGALCARLRNSSCELEKSELCSIHGAVKELLCAQNGSPAEAALLSRAQEAACDKQGGATRECAVTGDLENGFCTRNGRVKQPLDPQGRSASWDKHRKRTLSGCLAPVKWIRSHPKITLGVLILLLLLLLVFVVSLAVVSGRTQTGIQVLPDTPRLLACPHGWVGHRGICYFFSQDDCSWDQAQARCSELGASLAVLQDWEMGFLSRLCGNGDHWVRLRRRGRELQWGNGSSFSSPVPVPGNGECAYLSDGGLRSMSCSQQLPFICSRPQTHL